MRRNGLLQCGGFRSSMSSAGNVVSSFACALALVCAASMSARAQAVFQSTTSTYNVGSGPQGVAVADLNRDGKPDAIVADTSANQISVILSSGTSYVVNNYGTGSGSSPVAVAVVPNYASSGAPAVAVLEQGSSSVAIYTVSNTGALTLGTTYTVGAAPTGIVVADFNNDGVADIAVSYPTGVSILLGSVSGTFSNGAGALVGTNLVALAAGHFDTSANMDLAVVDQAGKAVDILIGNGSGGFTTGTGNTVGNTPTSIAVADFNHDTHEDLVVSNSTDATVSVLLGNGDGTFQAQTTSQVNGDVQSVAVADVNGDGIPDVLVTNPNNSSVGVLIGVGNGTFEQVMNPALSGSPYGIAVGDFNRDGKPDVIVTQNTAGAATVLLNNTLPTSPLPMGRNLSAPNLSYATGDMADAVTVADFNGDGIPDMAVAFFEDYTVQVLLGTGNGTFGTASTYAVGKHPYAIASADLNHDGYPDLVVANEADGTITVLLNNGTGGFTQASGSPITVGTQPTGVAIGDLNNDGIPDIAVTNYGSNNISILLGKGDGTFTAGTTLAAGSNPYNVVIGDFTGNGKNDIACTNKNSANMDVYLGNGDGTFQSPTSYATNALPTSIVTGDFNRDGNLDIAVGNSTANNISVFLGNGSGGFTSSTVTTLNFPVSMAVADMNGDGIPDIVNVNPNFDDVTVLLGNGDGTFTSRWQFPTGPGTLPNTCNQTKAEVTGAQPWAVAIGDFNLDGKPDVVTANSTERCNLTIPEATSWYQPALGAKLVGGPVPSTSVLLNGSGTMIGISTNPSGAIQDNPNNNPPDQVTINAQISPSLSGGTPTPTGAVEIEDTDGTELGIAPLSLSNGTASLTLPNLGSGQHTLGALYSGDTDYQPETNIGGNVLISVSGTLVSINITPNTFVYGSPTQFTLNITVYGNSTYGSPTGAVSVYFFTPQGTEYYVCGGGNGGCPAQYTISPSGGSNNSTTSLQVTDPSGYLNGIYEFYATYGGDGNYAPGSSADEQVDVTPTTPSIDDAATNCYWQNMGQGQYAYMCTAVPFSCTTNTSTVHGHTTSTTSCDAYAYYAKSEFNFNYGTWTPNVVQITSGTMSFSLNGASPTNVAINCPGGGGTNCYAPYSFTSPPDSDGDGDSDYVLTVNFTPSSGDTGMFGTATTTYCGSDGCNSSGTAAAARSTAINGAFGSGVLQGFGANANANPNTNSGSGNGYRYRKAFGIPVRSGSGGAGGVGVPPIPPNSRMQYGVIGKPGDAMPQFGAHPVSGSSGNGVQPQQPSGASSTMQPGARRFRP